MYYLHFNAGTHGNIKAETYKQRCGIIAKEILLALGFNQLHQNEVLSSNIFFKNSETYIKS